MRARGGIGGFLSIGAALLVLSLVTAGIAFAEGKPSTTPAATPSSAATAPAAVAGAVAATPAPPAVTTPGPGDAAPAAVPVTSPAPEGSPPAPPTGVTAKDSPGDEGKKITVTWRPSADDGGGTGAVVGYELLRGTSPAGPFEGTGVKIAAGVSQAVDEVPADATDYVYVVGALTTGPRADSAPSAPARSSPQWFNPGKTSVALFTFVFCVVAATVLVMARRGANFYIRPIGGINAIDEAIGRATEMGKPILYVCGLQEADSVSTLAAFSILSRVARKAAEYQSRLIVPCYYPMVMVVAREVVKGAYLEAGRPDAYREGDVFYVTQEQFAYVAAVNGIMLREKPATNFYLGAFYAESLVLAETGFRAGSIQIAGTDQPIQIPFFVAACDYTLIGEELYAAAAYLSDDPRQKATLKAQDFGKASVLALMAAAAVLWAVAPSWAVWFSKIVADGDFLFAHLARAVGMGS